ncbi:MAG: DsbA family oxidoreductase [Sorangiineae bacterium]|nr:DsbA family oxidoreductase [Sorangiineae bacterium]
MEGGVLRELDLDEERDRVVWELELAGTGGAPPDGTRAAPEALSYVPMKALVVDVWSDIACPWCYMGKRRLERALERFEHASAVSVVWHAFELDPTAPRELPPTETYAERLAKKYRTSLPRSQEMLRQMTETAARDGLELRFDRVRAGNTFDAHRVLHFALESGRQDALKERFFRAYFTDGQPIGDRDTLARLAGEVGLEPGAVRAMLASERLVEAVREDEREAAENEIRGVPFFVLGRRYAISGAQSSEVLLGALERAFRELPGRSAVTAEADAELCGADGCVVPPRPAE